MINTELRYTHEKRYSHKIFKRKKNQGKKFSGGGKRLNNHCHGCNHGSAKKNTNVFYIQYDDNGHI